MREPKTIDYILLIILALIWSSAFFNIKIATYSYGPVTIAFLRILFGAIPVVVLCLFKKINVWSEKKKKNLEIIPVKNKSTLSKTKKHSNKNTLNFTRNF